MIIAALALATTGTGLFAQDADSSGSYKILKAVKTGGDGGFDYVYADSAGRRRRGRPRIRSRLLEQGTLTVVKESSPTSFAVEQTVKTTRAPKR